MKSNLSLFDNEEGFRIDQDEPAQLYLPESPGGDWLPRTHPLHMPYSSSLVRKRKKIKIKTTQCEEKYNNDIDEIQYIDTYVSKIQGSETTNNYNYTF